MQIRTIPVVRTYNLQWKPDPDYDGEPGTITIRQANTYDSERLADETAERTMVWRDDETGKAVEERYRWNSLTRNRIQAYFTIVESNLEDEEGKPIFKSRVEDEITTLNMSQSAFDKMWGKLPGELTLEIHEYIIDMNPQWDPRRGSD